MDEEQRRLKKQWVEEQRVAARAAFPLSGADLAALFQHVGTRLRDSGCDHSLRFTLSWLAQHGHSIDRVVAWLRENGGFCDCEVDANVRDHWEKNAE